MTPTYALRIAAGLLATAACAACGGATRGARATQSPTAAQGDSAAVAKARADSARYPYTAADVHFMSAMIHHHAQALVMAGWAPTHGASPEIRTLAERIVNAQQDELATAQRWLRDRRQPVPDPHAMGMTAPMNPSADSGHAHAGHGTHDTQATHDMSMPGMLSPDQLALLDRARGPEFDRLFLRFMIQHHQGAVTMVKELFSTDGAAQDETVFKFANDVNVDQTTEIERMQKMLAAVLFERRAP